MAVDQSHDDRMVFAPLALMDGNGVGQGNFVDFCSFVLDVLFRITDVDHVVLDGKDLADVAVKHALFIVVVLLHDLVADAKDHVAALQFALAHDRGIETFLNELIEVIDAAGILVHRRQDLNSKFVARLLDFTAVQSADLRRPISFGLDFDEAKFQVFVDDRQASIVNQVGVSNDAAPFFLAENRIQANDGYHFRGDDVVEDGAGPDRRQLVGIPDEDAAALRFQSVQQMVHHFHIEHRHFVDDDQIGRQ